MIEGGMEGAHGAYMMSVWEIVNSLFFFPLGRLLNEPEDVGINLRSRQLNLD